MVLSKSPGVERGVINQYLAAVSGSLCYTIVGAATAWPSPTLIKMANHETPMQLDVTQVSWMVSLMFLGHITSPVPSGYLMDWLGRKRTCLYFSVLPLFSWLLILFADSAVHLYVARYAAGLWIGITNTIMPIYVGELGETKLRSSLTTINNGLLNFGVLFAYVIGPYVSYQILAIACEILTVVYIIAFIPMPESPHYFMKHGKRQEALDALSWFRKGQPMENIDGELNRIEEAIEDQKLQKGTPKDIFFDRGNRKAFIISVTYAIFKRTSGSGVMQAYISITLPALTMGFLDPDNCVIIVGFISFLSSIASTALSAKYRRHVLLTISCVGCGLTTGLIMVWFYLHHNTSVNVTGYSDVIFWSMAVYYAVFNIGLGPIGTSIKGEVFSANVKGLSSSLTTLTVAITSFIFNKYYLIIAQSAGMYVNYLIYSVTCVVTIVFTWTYVPDMHNRTLEEIRLMMKGEKIPPKNPVI
ncbi:hypothetical protein J6590_026351 [Homalodisca vitripennis]|nr:hypothetical protein J6590_026351 [Homalodisca vitripennis]